MLAKQKGMVSCLPVQTTLKVVWVGKFYSSSLANFS